MIKITSEKEVLFFKEAQIVFFEAKTNKTLLHFLSGEVTEIGESITSIEEQIKSNSFIKIHKNLLINVNHITGIPGEKPGFIELNKTLLLPISGDQRKIIMKLISAHLKT